MVLEAIKYDYGSVTLQILDQLQLPHKTVFRDIQDPTDAYDAIKSMQVRGAPAIAIVAALSVAVKYHALVCDTKTFAQYTPGSLVDSIKRDLDYLVTSRPTAVNLAGAAVKLKSCVAAAFKNNKTADVIVQTYVADASQMLKDDVRDNEAIGRHGSDWITGSSTEPVSVITHCNTGSLATAGYGTALGVIRSLHAHGSLQRAYFTETRPYNQGSRLTAFELLHDNIPATLITDSMAAALMQLKRNPERISAVVVGADRVAVNGDTANKIGTYALAIAAKHHDVKFLVAAPSTTIDLETATGRNIIIEERRGEEMTTVRGPTVHGNNVLDLENPETVSIAAKGVSVWNPAFDVTPSHLIDGIITEFGVVEKDSSGAFDLRKFLRERTGRATVLENGRAENAG